MGQVLKAFQKNWKVVTVCEIRSNVPNLDKKIEKEGKEKNQAWWDMPVIPAAQEAGAGG